MDNNIPITTEKKFVNKKVIDVVQLLKDLNDKAPEEFNAKVNAIILSQPQYDYITIVE